MSDEYLTAAAIVVVVITVSLIGGYTILSKMKFTRQRKTKETNKTLRNLLSKYIDWMVVESADQKFVEAGGKYSKYFKHGINPFFYPTVKANKMGRKYLQSHA